jgi:hypothetical protein
MGKKSSSATAPAAAKPDTSFSIDDIFASKPKPKSKTPVSTSSNAVASSSKAPEPPKKKKKKVNAIPAFIPDEPSASAAGGTEAITGEAGRKSKKAKVSASASVTSEPKRVVEEVLDPSIPRPAAPSHVPVVTSAATGTAKGKKREKRKEAAEDDEMFADSRGTGPSEYR